RNALMPHKWVTPLSVRLCPLYVSVYIKCAVENSQNIYDIFFLSSQVGNTKVAVQKNAYLSFLHETVYVAHVGEGMECLSLLVDAFNNPDSGFGIVGGDIAVSVPQPGLSFRGPPYFCHV